MHGEGKYIWPDGRIYEGLYKKDFMKMIKRMDLVFIFGQMEKNMKDHGKMEGNMAKGNIFFQMEQLKLESGKMEEE